MKKIQLKIAITASVILSFASACTDKLDLLPTNDITAETVYKTPAGYKQSLAKYMVRLPSRAIRAERVILTFQRKSLRMKEIRTF
jgi:hypothetical protein